MAGLLTPTGDKPNIRAILHLVLIQAVTHLILISQKKIQLQKYHLGDVECHKIFASKLMM